MRCLRTLPMQLEGTVEVITPPVRSSFYSFEQIDLTGLVIEITVRGRLPVVVTYDELSIRPRWYDNRHTGEQKVDLVYRTMIGKTTVNIIEQQYARIDAISHPSYTFVYGDEFHLGDLVVEGTFEHFGKEIIPNDELTFSLQEGQILDKTITELRITASNGVYTTVPVTVGDKLTSVVYTPPTKMLYTWGEYVEYDGLTATAWYNDDEYSVDVPLSECEITPSEGSRVTDTEYFTLSISYSGFSSSFRLDVVPLLDGLVIITPPDKTTYTMNEEIDYTGLVVGYSYNEGMYYEILEQYETFPDILTEGMVEYPDNTFHYTVKDDEGRTATGTMYWDGTAKVICQFRDWVPWQYREGLEVWDNYPDDVVYGWEDDDGNRVSFPYETTVIGVNKHNWEAIGVHPLHDHWNSEITGYELCKWVHHAGQLSNYRFNSWYQVMEFVGTDSTSVIIPVPFGCEFAKEFYAPYTDGEWRHHLSMYGETTYGTVRGKISVNSFHPALGEDDWGLPYTCRIYSNEYFDIEIINEIKLKRWHRTDYADYWGKPSYGEYYEGTMGSDCFNTQERGSIITNRYAYPTDLHYSYTFTDGKSETSSVYLRPGHEAKVSVYHIVDPPESKKKGNLIINNHDYVYEGLGEDLNVSLPWFKKIIVPIELKNEYLEVYPDAKVWYTENNVSKSVDLSFEYLDPYFPTYFGT